MQKNRLEVMGYLSAKPSVRYLPSGTPVANARLGESYRYQDTDGKSQQHTNWDSLSFYGDEVVVRTCHLIAAPRGTAAEEAAATAPEESSSSDLQTGVDQDGWPVG